MKKLIIFADFDGTVTRGNVTDAILSKFARADWKSFEEKYLAGDASAMLAIASSSN